MWFNHHEAERIMERRVRNELRQATQGRMIRVAEQAQERRSRHLPLHFILGCQVDTSEDRWEPLVGSEQYRQWRDSLMNVGWAEWLHPHKQEKGWKLTRSAPEIIRKVFPT
jgi:hypothetical protein